MPAARGCARPASAAPAPSGRPRRAGHSPRPRRCGAARRAPAGAPRGSARRTRRAWGRRRPARRARTPAGPARAAAPAAESISSCRFAPQRLVSLPRLAIGVRRDRPARRSASSSSRWRSGSSRARPSCWPWMSTRRSPSFWSVATVTGRPLTCAPPRPCAEIRRVMISGVVVEQRRRPGSLRPRREARRRRSRRRPPPGPRSCPTGSGRPTPCRPAPGPGAVSSRLLPAPVSPGPGAVALLELDMNVFDQRQVLNREFTQHGLGLSGQGDAPGKIRDRWGRPRDRGVVVGPSNAASVAATWLCVIGVMLLPLQARGCRGRALPARLFGSLDLRAVVSPHGNLRHRPGRGRSSRSASSCREIRVAIGPFPRVAGAWRRNHTPAVSGRGRSGPHGRIRRCRPARRTGCAA